MLSLISLLKKAPLFAGMDAATITFFAEHSFQKHYEKGAPLFSMGDPATRLFFIIDGWIKLYRVNRDGEETIINIFAPRETFAEAAAFGPAQHYPVSAQAVEDSTVLEIPRTLFIDKIREDSDFALSIIGSIAARQHYLVQMIEHLAVKTPPQRLGCFLLRLCPPEKTERVEVSLPYDKALIARRLSIQPETFSRALKKLEPHGVSTKGRSVIIQNTNNLRAFCDFEDRDRPC
jgi:CRP-like cAMP-binding protein